MQPDISKPKTSDADFAKRRGRSHRGVAKSLEPKPTAVEWNEAMREAALITIQSCQAEIKKWKARVARIKKEKLTPHEIRELRRCGERIGALPKLPNVIHLAHEIASRDLARVLAIAMQAESLDPLPIMRNWNDITLWLVWEAVASEAEGGAAGKRKAKHGKAGRPAVDGDTFDLYRRLAQEWHNARGSMKRQTFMNTITDGEKLPAAMAYLRSKAGKKRLAAKK